MSHEELLERFNGILHSRTPEDPNDEYSNYKEPLTTEQLAEAREVAHCMGERLGFKRQLFTCDACAQAPVCPVVFDAYNTNGDCLLEK